MSDLKWAYVMSGPNELDRRMSGSYGISGNQTGNHKKSGPT